MSTSGSYDNTTTMSLIIKDSFSLLNVIDDGEPISAEYWEYGKRKLNELMSYLSQRGGMWLIDDVSITLTPGTASYSMGVGETVDTPKPMSVIHARRITSSSTDIPVEVISRDEYLGLPNKTVQTPTTCVFYDRRRDTGTLYVWGTGTSSENSLKLTVKRPIQDFDAEGNNPDFPKEWVLPVTYQLAAAMAPKYKGGVVPPDIKEMADRFSLSLAINDEEVVPLRFEPE